MTYRNRQKKVSGFTKYNSVELNDRSSGLKNGGNATWPIQAVIDKVAEVFGGSFRVYEFESELIASDIQLGEYALVEENDYRFYKVTNVAPTGNDLSLTSGYTAEYITTIISSAEYVDLNINGSDTDVETYLQSQTSDFESMAALGAASPDADRVYIKSFYAGQNKGDHDRVPSGTTGTPGTYVDGIQFDADGNGWKVLSNEFYRTIDFGANNSSDSTAIEDALSAGSAIKLYGDTDFDSTVTITKPVKIIGRGDIDTITTPSSPTEPAFDFQAVGGSDRKKIRLNGLAFSAGSGQCIKATSTNPLEMTDMRFDTGAEALKLSTFYYGKCMDSIFFKSGADLDNVNNFDFIGTDANGNNAVSSGRFLATDYAFTLNNCIGVQFSQMSFEVWDCNVLRMTGCKAIAFNRTWFEANDSERVMLLIDCANISFNEGTIFDTTFAQPSDCVIQVANTNPSGTREVKTAITLNSVDLVLSQSATTSVPFVKTSDTAGAEKAIVTINDSTLISGFIHNPNLNTLIYVKNLTLSSPTASDDTKKGFTACNTVDVSQGRASSWCPLNANTEWDFATGTGGWTEVGAAGSTVSVVTSMAAGQPQLTGTKALKIATVGAVTSNMNLTMSDAGAITTAGETYFIAVKVWSDVNCSAKLRLLDNGSVPRDDSTTVMIGSNEWRWLVMKTNSANMASILASGLDPILRIDFTTTVATNIYIDRADFQIVNGDHHLP